MNPCVSNFSSCKQLFSGSHLAKALEWGWGLTTPQEGWGECAVREVLPRLEKKGTSHLDCGRWETKEVERQGFHLSQSWGYISESEVQLLQTILGESRGQQEPQGSWHIFLGRRKTGCGFLVEEMACLWEVGRKYIWNFQTWELLILSDKGEREKVHEPRPWDWHSPQVCQIRPL